VESEKIMKQIGGELARRPLQFIWIADCSASMGIGGKIQQLNTAIHEAIPHMQRVAADNVHAEVFVRAIKFSDGATWHISTPTPVEHFRWTDLSADGVTDMGKALLLVAEQLKMPPMDPRGLPPVLVLISDGQPTDDFETGRRALMAEPWGQRAVRVAISIGRDADTEVLQRFIGHPEMTPLQANDPETLVRRIRWASTVALKAASAPSSIPVGESAYKTIIVSPLPSPQPDPESASDVW
jgi:uncharacterized protein YegL